MSQQSFNKSLEVVIDNSIAPVTDEELSDKDIDFSNSDFYENRELSLLKFNSRVLQQAKNHKHLSLIHI